MFSSPWPKKGGPPGILPLSAVWDVTPPCVPTRTSAPYWCVPCSTDQCFSSTSGLLLGPVPCPSAQPTPYSCDSSCSGPRSRPANSVESFPRAPAFLGHFLFSTPGVFAVCWELTVVFVIQFPAGLCLLPFQASYAGIPHSKGRAGGVACQTM